MKLSGKRVMSFALAAVMALSLITTLAFAEGSSDKSLSGNKLGTSSVSFGDTKAYDVTADVSLAEGVISSVVFTHNAAENSHQDSAVYADAAKELMKDRFTGIAADDKAAVEAVSTAFPADAQTKATITAKAYKAAVLNALALDAAADMTFGSGNMELQPGVYKVPISLRHAVRHGEASKAAGAFPAMGQLTVDENGKAVLVSDVQTVVIGPISDMAYDIMYFKEDNCTSEMYPVTILEKTVKPDTMPGGSKEVPAKISVEIPDNHFDGVYLHFTVDAMGPGYPDAWLQIDYANAKAPGQAETVKGEAKVNQFGKYTVFNEITVQDGVIAGMKIKADNFISETHRPTNETKMAQATDALKNIWNGMAPVQDNAEAIFKKIMKPQNPDEVIDSVAGATYSAKAIRDSVMNAFGLDYQDEIIHVPESVEPGTYSVQIGYYSDVVWHSLVETVKTDAVLTVADDRTMILDFGTKSGTAKEPLYILGFNGIYPDNDKSQPLTKEGCTAVMGLSSNDYEDENFAKGTQVVNHLTFPLEGELNKVYSTNAYLYVPAMKGLNGEMSGVFFENGKFNVDIFAKIYWDTMKKLEPAPAEAESKGTVDIAMIHETKEQPSMCDAMFAAKAGVEIVEGKAVISILVANPVPGFADQGADGTVKNFSVTYGGKQYMAESDVLSKPLMTAKTSNSLFGLEEGKQYTSQVLTLTLPVEALSEKELVTDAYVNVVMMTDVAFRMRLSNLVLTDVKPENPDITGTVNSSNIKGTDMFIQLYSSSDKSLAANIKLGYENGEADSGSFRVTNLVPGDYDMVIKRKGHIDFTITGINVTEDDIDLNSILGKIELGAGDVNGDGRVNEGDVSDIRAPENINKESGEAVNGLSDVNGDGRVNEGDVSAARSPYSINKSKGDFTFRYSEIVR